MKVPEVGRDWARRWTASVARAVQAAREDQRLSAQAVSNRCAELGYPIPRTTIQNLEIGRKESISIQEVAVLARALSLPPILLLYPLGLGMDVETLPGVEISEWDAAQWFTGERLAATAEGGELVIAPEDENDWRRTAAGHFRKHEEYVRKWTAARKRIEMIRTMLRDGDPDKVREFAADIPHQEAICEWAENSIKGHRANMRDAGLVPADLPEELAHLAESEIRNG